MISVNRINYAGYSSQDFDLKTCMSFKGDSGDVDTFLGREAIASESHRGHFKRVHNYKYSDVLAPTITFIKDNFEDFTIEEQRKVLKWLTSRDTASFLTVYHDDSEAISYEILGGFIEINTHKAGSGRVVGFTAVFESVSPFAFSPLYTITKDVSNSEDNKITINLETDDPQNAVYPRITIKQGDSDGDVSIKNIYTDDNGKISTFDTFVTNNISDENVILDGANRVVSSSRTGGRTFGDTFSWNWLPLYEGKNELSFTGNYTATVEFRYPIKCGEF